MLLVWVIRTLVLIRFAFVYLIINSSGEAILVYDFDGKFHNRTQDVGTRT